MRRKCQLSPAGTDEAAKYPASKGIGGNVQRMVRMVREPREWATDDERLRGIRKKIALGRVRLTGGIIGENNANSGRERPNRQQKCDRKETEGEKSGQPRHLTDLMGFRIARESEMPAK